MLAPMRFAEIKAAGHLPSPSGPALELIALLSRDDVALGSLVAVIQSDPALTGRILKLVNSAAFARQRPAVAITPDVLMVIGLPALKQLVLVFSLVDGQRGGPCAAFDYLAFWSRALARGAAAQTLGSGTRLAPAAELFTLGLTADIGRLALASVEPERYDILLRNVGAGGTAPIAAPCDSGTATLLAREQAEFGFDHADLTVAILREWGLPQLFQEAALACENAGLTTEPGPQRPARLASLLRLAQEFSDLVGVDDDARMRGIDALMPRAQGLDLPPPTFFALADQTLKNWQEWGQTLGVLTVALTPFAVLEMNARNAEATPTDGPRGALRVLVVDDDAALRKLLEHLLAKAGYAVRAAADGKSGFEVALAWHPDIILTDLLMPHEDGIALTRRLRQGALGQMPYIMILTGVDDDEKLAEAFAAGVDDYIHKPLKPRTLLARLSAGARIVRLQHELAARNIELTAALHRAEFAAVTDALTGLPNRRYVIERLPQECAAAERSGRPLSVLMLDVDHFKRINDTHGHAVGDAVLKEIARRIDATRRLSDVAARFGGEEFLLLAVDTPLEQSIRLGERLREAIAAAPIAVGDLALPVTASIGVAEKSGGCHDFDILIKAADEALYQAKAAGRNRVAVVNQVIWSNSQ